MFCCDINIPSGDALQDHNGQRFSTADKVHDNDLHCAKAHETGWWFKYCATSNLNGKYKATGEAEGFHGIIWYNWKGFQYSLKHTEMKIRPN